MVLGWMSTFVSIHAIKYLVRSWITISGNTPLGLVLFVLIGIPVFVVTHIAIAKLILARYPQHKDDLMKIRMDSIPPKQ